jgi:uncharacterized phage-associated protein
MNPFNNKKAVQAINYFATKNGGEISKMVAIKLLWLSDRVHLLKYGRMISNDTYYAMEYGPVGSSTRNNLESLTNNIYESQFLLLPNNKKVKSIAEPDLMVFSDSDEEVLELVFSKVGHFDFNMFKEWSHEFTEWKRFKNELEANPRRSFKMVIDDFFNDYELLAGKGIEIEKEVIGLNKEYFFEFA